MERARYHRRIMMMTPNELIKYRVKMRRKYKRWYDENRKYVIERVLERRQAARVAVKKTLAKKGAVRK